VAASPAHAPPCQHPKRGGDGGWPSHNARPLVHEAGVPLRALHRTRSCLSNPLGGALWLQLEVQTLSRLHGSAAAPIVATGETMHPSHSPDRAWQYRRGHEANSGCMEAGSSKSPPTTCAQQGSTHAWLPCASTRGPTRGACQHVTPHPSGLCSAALAAVAAAVDQVGHPSGSASSEAHGYWAGLQQGGRHAGPNPSQAARGSALEASAR
jgi:hypothetical protein